MKLTPEERKKLIEMKFKALKMLDEAEKEERKLKRKSAKLLISEPTKKIFRCYHMLEQIQSVLDLDE